MNGKEKALDLFKVSSAKMWCAATKLGPTEFLFCGLVLPFFWDVERFELVGLGE
jgi:hypothetical protein